MVDMTMDMDENIEKPQFTYPTVPYGLCISLTNNELEKLDLDDGCEVGDLLHMVCMARVRNVNKSELSCRIEMEIFDIEVLEDENQEYERPTITPSKFYKT